MSRRKANYEPRKLDLSTVSSANSTVVGAAAVALAANAPESSRPETSTNSNSATRQDAVKPKPGLHRSSGTRTFSLPDMPPPSKKAKFSSSDIHQLSDNDLTKIFKHLPPYERLAVSEVCRRWYELSRKAWLDIKHLDLSPIPGKSINAILKCCPRLQTVFASQKSFDLNELSILCKVSNASTLKFYGCQFELPLAEPGMTHNVFAEIFTDQLAQTSLVEFVVHDAYFWQAMSFFVSRPRWAFDVNILPVSLTRLQLSGFYAAGVVKHLDYLFLLGLETLQNLECFILHTTPRPPGEFDDYSCHELIDSGLNCDEPDIFEKIKTLKNLKELCIGPPRFFYENGLEELITSLPKLEVLFLNDINCDLFDIDDLEHLITGNPVLRILVLSGEFLVRDKTDDIVLAPRKRFPQGFGSDTLPLLHIFVGREASENIIFEKSSSDAAVIHPIDAPMPEFLKRADIAPIFEGVWVAEKIKEAAENDARLWDYEELDDASSILEL